MLQCTFLWSDMRLKKIDCDKAVFTLPGWLGKL